MHIKDTNNNRYISEDEYKVIKSELSFGHTREELALQEEEDNIYHKYILNHKTPEQIIRNKLEDHNEKLESLFFGTEIQAYEADSDMSENKLVELCDDLNAQNYSNFYIPFMNEDKKYYVVEQLRAQPANISLIADFIIKHVQSIHIEVNLLDIANTRYHTTVLYEIP